MPVAVTDNCVGTALIQIVCGVFEGWAVITGEVLTVSRADEDIICEQVPLGELITTS